MTFGGQLLLLVAAAAPVALLARERRWRIMAGATAALGVIALAGTFTRSAWIGLTVALATTLAALRPWWLPALAVLCAAVYLLAPGSYRDRLHSAFDPHHPMNLERTYMWDAGARMFRDHPLTGVGLEDLHPIYDRYRLAQAHERVGHLHSVPVQIAATMGIVGLAAFAALYGALMCCAAAGLAPMLRSASVETGLRVGVLAGLVGFLVAGLFEWNFGDEELLYLLFTLAGLAWSARRWHDTVAEA
jgi:O-antigen ligase